MNLGTPDERGSRNAQRQGTARARTNLRDSLGGRAGLTAIAALLCFALSGPAPFSHAQSGLASEIRRIETLVAEGDYVSALAASRAAAQTAPSDYRTRYYAGMALLGLQRFDEARAEADLALALAPAAERAGVERLVAAIDLQGVSQTAEADAEAALASGLNVRAARLFAQAFEADASKTEAGFRAAELYAGSLDAPADAARILRKIEDQSPDSTARARAAEELKTLAPRIRPIVDDLVRQARSAIDAGDASAAARLLGEAAALDAARADIAIEDARLAALGNDARALETALLALAPRGAEIADVVFLLPQREVWAGENWFLQLLEDYRGAGYAAEIAQAAASGFFPRTSFRDCTSCPEMVVLPSGSFTMGSPESEGGRSRSTGEGPQRTVRIRYQFAVGKYEVTFAEWDACTADGGCGGYRPSDRGWGRGNRPAINVSWEDAQSYVQWLSRKTGHRYRLLSEAEWEYAARAGSQARWSFGDDESRLGSFAWFSSNSNSRTQPVGGKTANAFGLHDMHGNVWEWTQDCYANSYEGAPSDGSARTTGDCSSRVSRGGSWDHSPQGLRSAGRVWDSPGFRYIILGFRVARTLPP